MNQINELRQRLAKIITVDDIGKKKKKVKKKKRKRPIEMDDVDEALQIDTREDWEVEEGEEDTKAHYKGSTHDDAKDILEDKNGDF